MPRRRTWCRAWWIKGLRRRQITDNQTPSLRSEARGLGRGAFGLLNLNIINGLRECFWFRLLSLTLFLRWQRKRGDLRPENFTRFGPLPRITEHKTKIPLREFLFY